MIVRRREGERARANEKRDILINIYYHFCYHSSYYHYCYPLLLIPHPPTATTTTSITATLQFLLLLILLYNCYHSRSSSYCCCYYCCCYYCYYYYYILLLLLLLLPLLLLLLLLLLPPRTGLMSNGCVAPDLAVNCFNFDYYLSKFLFLKGNTKFRYGVMNLVQMNILEAYAIIQYSVIVVAVEIESKVMKL